MGGLYKHRQQYGLREHCVEVGCGAGRITKQLAACFQRVSALDVSEHQLTYAKLRVGWPLRMLILFSPMGDGVCTGAFSSHVFQHFDTHEEAHNVLREVHRVLRARGSLMIHLPIYQFPDMPVASLLRRAIWLVKRIGDVRAAANRRLLTRGG